MAIKILLVDDDLDLLDMLRRTLEREGYIIETAANGLEALEKIRQATPDLVISDVRMPVCDGIQLLNALNDSGHAKVPVLLISGFTGLDEAPLKHNSHYIGFMQKPVRRAELLSFLKDFASQLS